MVKLRHTYRLCRPSAGPGLICAVLIAILCGPLSGADADRHAAEQLIKETVAGAKSSADAAARLMHVSGMLKDTPKVQADFCRKAYEYGVKTAAGQTEALAAIATLITLEPENADLWAEKRIGVYRTIYSRAKADKKPAIGLKIVECTEQLAAAKAAKQRWSESLKLYTSAMRTATALRLEKRSELAEKVRSVTAEMNRAKRFALMEKKLVAEPDNEELRSDIVEMCLLEYDSPQRAAEFVTEDGDETLRTYLPLAAKALAELPEPQCMELGFWYRSLAGGVASKTRKIVALDRAIGYLQRYLDLHKNADAYRKKASAEFALALTARRKLGGSLAPRGAVLILTFEKRTLSTVGGKKYFNNAGPGGLRGMMIGGSFVAGQAGSAMKFDGKAYVNFGNPKTLQITGSQTTCMWLKPANLSARQNPLNKCYGGEGTWTIELSGSINYFCGASGTTVHPYSGYALGGAVKPGRWSHVAVVRDARAKKVHWYKNGLLVNSYTLKYKTKASKSPLWLGKGYMRNYQGLMDEVAIFNRALTANEIKRIFEAGQKGLTLN